MTLEEILAITERIGSGDNPPTSTELSTARTELSRLLHTEARAEAPDLSVMASIRQAYTVAGTALIDAQAREQAARDQITGMLDGVDDPDVEVDPPAPEATPPVPDGVLPAPEGAPAPDPVQVPEPVAAAAAPAAAAPPRTMSLRDAAARVVVRPPMPESEETGAVPGARIFRHGREIDHVPTVTECAAAFTAAMRSPSTGKETVFRFDSTFEGTPVLPGSKEGNTRIFDEYLSVEAVAAAGGCCSLPTPIRTQNVLSSNARPLRDSLPTLGVQESGQVMYFPQICLPNDGAWIWTCEDDELVDAEDDATWKNYIDIECPVEDRTVVDAVYHAFGIGEFQRRFAPEQWAGVIRATLAYQARVADNQVWSKMIAGVTATHTAAATGSLFTTMVQAVQAEADFMRQSQRLLDTVQLHYWVPGWTVGAIASDFAARRLESIADPTVVRTLISGALANAGVNVTFGIDHDPMTKVGNAAAQYPATATTILAHEGFYSFLEGGQFDLGYEIRDLPLARQNKVASFAESFEGVLARGCLSYRINLPVDICNDAAGCPGS